MKNKLKSGKIIKWGFISGYLLLIIVLLVEAAIPGSESAKHSNAAGNIIGDFIDGLGGGNIKIIEPTELILTNLQASYYVGDKVVISTKIIPSDATYQSLQWEVSDSTIATIDPNGEIVFHQAGDIELTARIRETDIRISKTITVSNVELEQMKIVSDNRDLYVHGSLNCELVFIPTNVTVKDVTWSSSDESIAIVSDDGIVQGLKKGCVTITATHKNGVNDSIEITVFDIPTIEVTEIAIIGKREKIYIDQSILLSAVILPNNATYKNVNWMVDNDVATINARGYLTACKLGVVTVTATTSNGHQDSCQIEIINRPEVSSFELQSSSLSLTVNTTIKVLISNILPIDALLDTVNWQSSAPHIATVTDGIVRGISPGEATITAQLANGVQQVINITVEAGIVIGVEELIVDEVNTTFYLDNIFRISYQLYPLNATDRSVNISIVAGDIPSNLITIMNNNDLLIKKTGWVTLRLESSQNSLIFDEITITISEVFAEQIVVYNQAGILENHQMTLGSKEFINIEIISCIPGLKVTNDLYAIDISDKTVIEIDYENNIIAKKIGTSIVKIYHSNQTNVTYSFEITVICLEVEDVKIALKNGSGLPKTLNVNSMTLLTAIINPINATYSNIYWESSDERIATINQNGQLFALRSGNVQIILKSVIDPNIYDIWNIQVLNTLPSKITITNSVLASSNAILNAGTSIKITIENDERASYQKYTYKSSDEKIAVVSPDGVVTTKSKGVVVITIYCSDGIQPSLEEKLTITVKLPSITDLFDNFQLFIRKAIGHFGAFLILGILACGFYFIIIKRKYLAIILILLSGFIVALTTEIIQLYTVGRSGLMSDVMLDYFGYLSSTVIIIAVNIGIIIYQKHKNRQIKNE